jgi:hypothetical protein
MCSVKLLLVVGLPNFTGPEDTSRALENINQIGDEALEQSVPIINPLLEEITLVDTKSDNVSSEPREESQ